MVKVPINSKVREIRVDHGENSLKYQFLRPVAISISGAIILSTNLLFPNFFSGREILNESVWKSRFS